MNFHSKELHTVKILKIVRQPKSAAYYIRKAKKNQYSLKQEDVMPFLEFFIEYCHQEEADVNMLNDQTSKF